MTGDVNDLFAQNIREQHAIDAAWRQIVRAKEAAITLEPFIAQIKSKCPEVNEDDLRYELRRRIANYRPRGRSRK